MVVIKGVEVLDMAAAAIGDSPGREHEEVSHPRWRSVMVGHTLFAGQAQRRLNLGSARTRLVESMMTRVAGLVVVILEMLMEMLLILFWH